MARTLNHGASWTPAEDSRLRELYPKMRIREFASLFDRSPKALRSRARVLRLQKNNGRRFWTFADDWIVRAYFPHIETRIVSARLRHSYSSTSQRAGKVGARKTPEYMEAMLRECGRMATTSGAATRFPKGHVSANKGVRAPGWGPGRMKDTQFKKLNVPANVMPLWSFRWVDGYLMLKTGAPTPKPTTGWEYVHKLIWEQANGPLPHWTAARLWWRDGDHSNCALSNLELVTAREHMRRTTIHNFPSPLREVIQLKGALKRRIGRMEKQNAEEHDGRPTEPSICDDRSVTG